MPRTPYLCAFLILGGLCTPAMAMDELGPHMLATGEASQITGHYEYCLRWPLDCQEQEPMPEVVLTATRLAELQAVNDIANQAIRPRTDFDKYGRQEYWTLPADEGDCEDYVLLKRKLLRERGWPASSLLITVVEQFDRTGRVMAERHAVLTVRTDQADFILDNLEKRVLPWNEARYRFLKRQTADHAGKWEAVLDYAERATKGGAPTEPLSAGISTID